MDRQRSSKSRLSSLGRLVVAPIHEVFSDSKLLVMVLAVGMGIEVKDVIVSSGFTLRSFTCVRKELTLLIERVEVLTRGRSMLARYFDKLYVGDPGRETIERSGMLGL